MFDPSFPQRLLPRRKIAIAEGGRCSRHPPLRRLICMAHFRCAGCGADDAGDALALLQVPRSRRPRGSGARERGAGTVTTRQRQARAHARVFLHRRTRRGRTYGDGSDERACELLTSRPKIQTDGRQGLYARPGGGGGGELCQSHFNSRRSFTIAGRRAGRVDFALLRAAAITGLVVYDLGGRPGGLRTAYKPVYDNRGPTLMQSTMRDHDRKGISDRAASAR